MKVNGIGVSVVIGYRYWPRGIKCGICHGRYLCIEKVETDDTYIVGCWGGCKLRASPDHPFVVKILAAYEQGMYKD